MAGRQLLDYAIKGRVERVREMLTVYNVDVNTTNSDGWTALHWASIKGHEDLARLLLDQDDVDVNVVTRMNGWTALMLASLRGHTDIVRALLDVDGVAVNVDSTYSHRTALMEASYWGHEDIVRALLAVKDIEVNTTDKYGNTALQNAKNEDIEALFANEPSV